MFDIKKLWHKLPPWLRDFDYSAYYSNNYVVVDFETTILDKGSPYEKDNKIVCSSYRLGIDHPSYTPETKVVVGNEYEQRELVDLIEQADFFVAHNAKFEYGWLERCGLDISRSLSFCTQIAEHVIKSNKKGSLSLSECANRWHIGNKEKLGSLLLKSGVCPSEWPENWLLPYSAVDSIVGEKLFLKQRNALIKMDSLKTVFTRNIFTPVIVSIERKGMHLDKDRVVKLHASYANRLRELKIAISDVIGGANPSSPKQMREVLYNVLKFKAPKDKKWMGKNGNTPTTSFSYINTIPAKTKKQRKFKELQQEYSKVNAALNKSLTKFRNCVEETEDHILTASLNQTITVTHRLSSTGRNYKAQFQNFPRIFKPLFSAEKEGWEIGEIDQAQLEYRVAVWYGQDEAGLYDIEHGVDSHAFTAEKIYGDKFTNAKNGDRKFLRTSAKAHTFKPLFGGQSGTKDEVKYYKAFKHKHTGITKAQESWKNLVLQEGKHKIPSGLTFYYPDTKMNSSGYMNNTTIICNYPVQSLATADIVPIGVTYQWHLMRLANLESYLVNTVHDSSIAEVHPKEKEIFSRIGELSSTKVVYKYLKKIYNIDFNVPLDVEVQISKNWNDSEEWKEQYLK